MTELEFIETIAAIEIHAKQASSMVLVMSSSPGDYRDTATQGRTAAAVRRIKDLAESLNLDFVETPR